MSEAKKISEADFGTALAPKNLMKVEAHAENTSTSLPRLILLLRKHQVGVTHLEFTKQPSGLYITFTSDSPVDKITRVCNEARRLEEFCSIVINDKTGTDAPDNKE